MVPIDDREVEQLKGMQMEVRRLERGVENRFRVLITG
jgi:hypothetical protein